MKRHNTLEKKAIKRVQFVLLCWAVILVACQVPVTPTPTPDVRLEDRVPDAVLRRMVQAGVVWVPTLEALHGHGADNLARFVAAGGQVALGTDAGYLAGLEIGLPMDEMILMQEAGMTPMQIILSATRNAAHVCRLDHELGTLETGKLADVLVVDGDPLEDLQALTQVRLVIHEGVIIRQE